MSALSRDDEAPRLRVAFVHHSSALPPEPTPGDLSLFLELLENSARARCSPVAWDDPSVDWTAFTHLFLTSKLNYVPQLEEFLRWLSRVESALEDLPRRMFNPPDVARWNVSKNYLLELEGKGVRIPPTVWLRSEGDLDAWERRGCPVVSREIVVKDVVDESGLSAWRCRVEADGKLPPPARDRLARQLSLSRRRDGTMIQQFLPAVRDEGEWSIVFFGGDPSHVALKRPGGGDGDFRVQQRYGGRSLPTAMRDVPRVVLELGHSVMTALPFRGAPLFARVDVVRADDGGACLMEAELLDPFLYLTEPQHAEYLLQAFLRAVGMALPR